MPRKSKTVKKGQDPNVTAVFREVLQITGVPATQFGNRKNRESDTVLARSLAISLLRLSGLGLEEAIEPFGLRSTQTVYQAANRVREAVKADNALGASTRVGCATLGIDPTPLLGSEPEKTALPKARDLLLGAGGISTDTEKPDNLPVGSESQDPLSKDWESGVECGVQAALAYVLWQGNNARSASLLATEFEISEAELNAGLVRVQELINCNSTLRLLFAAI